MPKCHLISSAARCCVIFTIALNAASAFASGGPPMVTDDPGTPGDHQWEINLAALSARAAETRTYQLPLIDANYGVGDRVQLKFEMPWVWQSEPDGSHFNGVGRSLAGLKWRFYDAGEDGWHVSTYPQLEFNVPGSTSPRKGLVESGTSFLAPLEFVHAFGDWDVNFEVGRWLRPAGHADSWIAGVVLTRQIKKGFEVMAELHEEINVGQSRQEQILNFGARYDFSERYTLLLAVGRDLKNTLDKPNTLLTYTGLQVKF